MGVWVGGGVAVGTGIGVSVTSGNGVCVGTRVGVAVIAAIASWVGVSVLSVPTTSGACPLS